MKIIWRMIVLFVLIMLLRCTVGCAPFTTNKNIEVDDELSAHAKENGYATFIDYMEQEMNQEEYEEVKKLLDENQINQELQTLKYSSVSGKDDYCYINGTYTIPYNVRMTVLWARNINIDTYNGNFYCNRHYAVSSSDKEAYLLIGSSDTGYRIVRIVPDTFEDVDCDVDFTKEGFNLLCSMIENKKQSWLANFSNSPVITNELLGNLYANEDDYECIYEYAKHLSEAEQQEIQQKLEQGQFEDGIVTIQNNKPFRSNYYKYEDGVYVVDSDYCSNVKWTQNIEEITDEEVSEKKYKIVNMQEDAYILLTNSNGFILIRFMVA